MKHIERLLTLVFVPHCAACDARLPDERGLCDRCATSLYPLDTACPRCAEPAAGPVSTPCARCRREPLPLERITAPYRFGGELAEALRRLKFGRRPDIARSLAPLLAPGLAAAADGADLVVPIPLGWRRMQSRGFNQAHVLCLHAARVARANARARAARAAASETEPPAARICIDAACLRRVRATAPQSSLGVRARAANVAGAFAVPRRARRRIAGRRILLVDDVVTTGATMAACARALLGAGAAHITGFAAARAEA